jgi:hypothetical protein
MYRAFRRDADGRLQRLLVLCLVSACVCCAFGFANSISTIRLEPRSPRLFALPFETELDTVAHCIQTLTIVTTLAVLLRAARLQYSLRWWLWIGIIAAFLTPLGFFASVQYYFFGAWARSYSRGSQGNNLSDLLLWNWDDIERYICYPAWTLIVIAILMYVRRLDQAIRAARGGADNQHDPVLA